MERMIRVVLFLALASLGLDHGEDLRTRQRFDGLKPPRLANAWHELLNPSGPPPLPPPPTPPPAPLGEFP
jgi:hypothetical protein